MDNLLIVGGGGHAREVADIVQRLSGSLAGVVVFVEQDHLSDLDRRKWDSRGVEVVTAFPSTPHEFVVAVGDPALRSRLVDAAESHGLRPRSLISPDALVSKWATLSPGAIVFPHAVVSSEVELGPHVHLNQGSRVSHDATLAAFVTLSPNACVTGGATLGERAQLGTGAVVLPGLHVGRDAVVGAGAVVVHDVPDGTTVKGNPAR